MLMLTLEGLLSLLLVVGEVVAPSMRREGLVVDGVVIRVGAVVL